MYFSEVAQTWLNDQQLIKSALKTTSQILRIYINPILGYMDIEDITYKDIERVFNSERILSMGQVFTDKVEKVLCKIFKDAEKQFQNYKNPMLHFYDLYVFSHEKYLLSGNKVMLTKDSPFVDVSITWLHGKNYGEVTFNLYLHFLIAYIHPFIGRKTISLINQKNILAIFTYFNTVITNQKWIDQIYLVLRMIFQYGIDLGIVFDNPLSKINDPYLTPVIELSNNEKNSVRMAFNIYGFRKEYTRELVKELYRIRKKNIQSNFIDLKSHKSKVTFSEVFYKWLNNTQTSILSDSTSKSAFHSMEIYAVTCFGDDPIDEISLLDLESAIDAFYLMGNTSDYYLISRFKSIFEYAKDCGYVKKNIAFALKPRVSSNMEKTILASREIKTFLDLCSESMYGFMFAITLCLGLRIREAMGIKVLNLDFENYSIKISGQIKKGKYVEATKTRKSRQQKVGKTAIFFINKALEKQEEFQRNRLYNNQDGLLFTNEEGKPLSYTNSIRKLNSISQKIGRSDITPHTLRHTYMTLSSYCSNNLIDIQRSVGHSTKASVISDYLHLTDDGIHQSAIKRENYLKQLMEKYPN